MVTRTGKIARLPENIRHKLNRRLANGEQGKDLVQWLNGLDEVKEVLSRYFQGRPVTEKNLSEWKQGGFPDWKREKEAARQVSRLVELSDRIDGAHRERSLTDRIASVLAVELAAITEKLLDEAGDAKERWKMLRDAVRTLNLQRRSDLTEARVGIQQERWGLEKEDLLRAERTRLGNESLQRPMLVKAFGGGETGERLADIALGIDPKMQSLHEDVDEDAPDDFPEDDDDEDPIPAPPDSSQSGPMAPDGAQSG